MTIESNGSFCSQIGNRKKTTQLETSISMNVNKHLTNNRFTPNIASTLINKTANTSAMIMIVTKLY